MIREEFLRLLREDEAFREEVRRQILTDDLLAVPGRLGRLEALLQQTLELQRQTLEAVRTMAERMAEFAAAVEARFDRVEARLDRVEARLDGVETRLDRVEARLDRVERDVGDLKGMGLEAEWRATAPARLGRRFRRVRVLTPEALADLAEAGLEKGVFTADEADEVRRADVVAEARDPSRDAAVRVVVEVSWRVGWADVERARRRADLLGRLGVEARAVAAGREVEEGVVGAARAMGVAVIVDGREVTGLWESPT